jgi:hypothetical protein
MSTRYPVVKSGDIKAMTKCTTATLQASHFDNDNQIMV